MLHSFPWLSYPLCEPLITRLLLVEPESSRTIPTKSYVIHLASHRVAPSLLYSSHRRPVQGIPLLLRLCRRTTPSHSRRSLHLVHPWQQDSTLDCKQAVLYTQLHYILIISVYTAFLLRITSRATSQLLSSLYRIPILFGCTADRQVTVNKEWSLPVRIIFQDCLVDRT